MQWFLERLFSGVTLSAKLSTFICNYCSLCWSRLCTMVVRFGACMVLMLVQLSKLVWTCKGCMTLISESFVAWVLLPQARFCSQNWGCCLCKCFWWHQTLHFWKDVAAMPEGSCSTLCCWTACMALFIMAFPAFPAQLLLACIGLVSVCRMMLTGCLCVTCLLSSLRGFGWFGGT